MSAKGAEQNKKMVTPEINSKIKYLKNTKVKLKKLKSSLMLMSSLKMRENKKLLKYGMKLLKKYRKR